MTYQEVLENACAVLSKNCKACPVCNGKACGNHIPGPGAKGAFGILLMAVGVIMIARKKFAVDLIFSVFGILILADALFKIQMSVDAKRFGLVLWWQILLIALVTGVIGFLVFIRPFEAAATMMALVGFSILLEGILNLWVGILTIKIIKSRL